MEALSRRSRRDLPGPIWAPFEVLVERSDYRRVAANWAASNFVVGGAGAAFLATLILLAKRPLPGFHPVLLYVMSVVYLGCGLLAPRLFRRGLRLGMTVSGLFTVAAVGLFAAGAGHTLSASVAQGSVLVAASAPLLYPRTYALLILAGSVLGCTIVFFTQEDGVAPLDRAIILIIQAGLYAALMLWFAGTLRRMGEAERQARAETEATLEELTGVDERRRSFLTKMSHELRTPLNAIIGFSDMLHLGLVGPLTDKQHEYVGDITSSGRHLLALVNDVLDVGQVETGHVDLVLSAVSPERVVSESVSLCRQEASRRQIAISIVNNDRISDVIADERKVKQILLNLLSNSLKFTPAGGKIKVRLTNAGEAIDFSVSDSGPGIHPDDLERIFRAYDQGGLGRPEHQAAGTGLGLAVARRLAESHGGTLTVRSALGEGATFTLRLPVNPTVTERSDKRGRRASGPADSGDPGIFSNGSALERLAGKDGLARYRARITGVAAVVETLTAGLLQLLPRPQGFNVAGWPWAGIGGVGLGLFLLRPKAKLSANQMYVLTVLGLAATTWYISQAGRGMASSFATFLVMEGLAAFTFFRFRRAVVVGLEVAIGYGLVEILNGNRVPFVRWTLTVSMVAAGALMARWLLKYLPRIVESENRARRETEQITAELVAASRHKSEFLASMSHELRTPLNAVIGFAEALEAGVFGPLQPKQGEYVADIGSAGRRLLSLINDILDLAKADAGRLELNVAPCAVGEVLQAATEQAARAAEAAGIAFSVVLATPDFAILADPSRLTRAVECLVHNAVAFSRLGGDVAVVARELCGTARIEVRDSGPGIAPADLERIFAPFEHAVDRNQNPGSGIGLALARQLVELHEGQITVESVRGKGSTFTIELPTNCPTPPAEESAYPGRAASIGPPTAAASAEAGGVTGSAGMTGMTGVTGMTGAPAVAVDG